VFENGVVRRVFALKEEYSKNRGRDYKIMNSMIRYVS
jgi:hypothetical protein